MPPPLSGRSLAIHFLRPSVTHLFSPPPLSFSQCTHPALNILPFMLHGIQFTDRECHKQDAERTHCVASMPNRHSNLYRVKHRVSIVLSAWPVLGGERWWERRRKRQDGVTTFLETLPDFCTSARSVAASEWTVTSHSIGGGDSEKDGLTAPNEAGERRPYRPFFFWALNGKREKYKMSVVTVKKKCGYWRIQPSL